PSGRRYYASSCSSLRRRPLRSTFFPYTTLFRSMARLSHPNVVTVHDVGEVDGQVFVAMELIDGRTLRDWLRERPRARREVLDARSGEHTSELQSLTNLVCRLLPEKQNQHTKATT